MKLSTILIGLCALASAEDDCTARRNQTTDSLCSMDLDAFMHERNVLRLNKSTERRLKCLDWEADGCTNVPDSPLGNNFEPACQRHDFCWRNTYIQKRWASRRDDIDAVFKKDLLNICPPEHKRTFLDRLGGAVNAVYRVTLLGWLFREATDGEADALPLTCKDTAMLYYYGVNKLAKFLDIVPNVDIPDGA